MHIIYYRPVLNDEACLLQFAVTGLKAGTMYSVRVRAVTHSYFTLAPLNGPWSTFALVSTDKGTAPL